jgi:DNA-binding transcriptional regulator YiaG
MTTFATQLKSEISRIARKEIKSDSQALKQASSRYRSEIAELKRRVASLEAMVKKLSKGAAKTQVQPQEEAGGALRFRAGGFASLRKKLGLSANEMGQLLGVSAQSIYHWEAGKTKPRASQLQAIARVRQLGKRQVHTMLHAATD